ARTSSPTDTRARPGPAGCGAAAGRRLRRVALLHEFLVSRRGVAPGRTGGASGGAGLCRPGGYRPRQPRRRGARPRRGQGGGPATADRRSRRAGGWVTAVAVGHRPGRVRPPFGTSDGRATIGAKGRML